MSHPLILVYAYCQFAGGSDRGHKTRNYRRVYALCDLEAYSFSMTSSSVIVQDTMMLVLGDELCMGRVLENMLALKRGHYTRFMRISQEDPYLTRKGPKFKVAYMTHAEAAQRSRVQKLFLQGLLPMVFVNGSFVAELSKVTSLNGIHVNPSCFVKDPRSYLHFAGTRLSMDAHRAFLLNKNEIRGAGRFTKEEIQAIRKIPSHRFSWFVGKDPAVRFADLTPISSIDILSLPAISELPLNFSINDALY